jgi:hypothetical protein
MGLARQRWALFVSAHAHGRNWPYFCLLLTITLGILQFTRYARVHFLLVMLPVTAWAFERLAFTELLAERDAEVARLRRHTADSSNR